MIFCHRYSQMAVFMDDSFRDIEFELYGNLVQIRNILSYYDTQDDVLTEINQTIAQIKSKTYNVAVMGEFKRGKSSLINALLGLNVLPSDVTPTTATINRITFGTEPKATIHFIDGRKNDIAISELQAYVTKLTDENERIARSIREAVIYYPTVICQNHVDIIDTPGLNDDEAMTTTTLNILNNIDAVIVTISALFPFSETEKKFVAQLIGSSSIRNIMFVVTFIDQIDEEDLPKLLRGIRNRICTMTKEELRARYAGQPQIIEKGNELLEEDSLKFFHVSAAQALKSFTGNDRRLLKKSRFPEFKEELYTTLTAQQSVNIVEKTASLIGLSFKRFDSIYQEKFGVIASRIQWLKTALEQTSQYFSGKTDQIQACRQNRDEALLALLNRSKQIKEEAIGLFVGELTKVRLNEAYAIRSAINTGKAKFEDHARKIALDDTRILRDLFQSVSGEIAARRIGMLLNNVEAESDIHPKSAEAFLAEFHGQLAATLNLAFAVQDDLIPKCANLAHCNVIEHIRSAVSSAIGAYLLRLKDTIESCWSVCYTFLCYDDGYQQQIAGDLRGALNKAETDMLVCQGNCNLHKRMVEDLVSGTESLLARFRGRG